MLFCVFTVATVLIADPATAQDEAVLEEIVVTAQRREQNLQEVPVSVTVFSGEDIQLGNINSMSGYMHLTPNVSFSEDSELGGSRGVNIGIRGVSDVKSGENSVVNGIGIYLDEFSVTSFPSGSINPFLPDMERIEILRGPQGTYFGRNSLGGALNLTTTPPGDYFEADFGAEARSYDTRGTVGRGTLMLNVPLSETFATRGLLFYEDGSGKVENIDPNGVGTGHEYFMGRLTGLWTPNDKLSVKLMAMYTNEDQDGDEIVPSGVWNVDTVDGYQLGVSNLTEAVNPYSIGFWPDNQDTVSRDLREFTKNEGWIGVLKLGYEVADGMLLKVISGVIDAEQARRLDNDLLGGWDSFSREWERDGTSYSTELRLELSRERFDWTTGILYADDDQDQNNLVLAGTQTADPVGPLGPDPNGVSLLPPIPPNFCFLCDQKRFRLQSAALFTDFTWRATDDLELIVGGRYTRDQVDTRLDNYGFIYPDLTLMATASGEQDFDDFSPRVGARVNINDDVNVYALVSKGYKAGGTSLGFNADPVNVPLPPVIAEPFKEETVWNYELGLKSEWFNRRLRINAAAFYMDWSNFQLEVFRFLVPGNLQSKFALTANVEESEAAGAEVEFAAAITDRFTLSGGLGYLDTEITKSNPQELSGGFIVDLVGLDLPKSPRWTANAIGEYRWPMSTNEAWVRAEYIYRDSQMSNIEALTWEQTRGQFLPNHGTAAFLPATPDGYPFVAPSYSLVNLRTGLDWGNFRVMLYVENLFDEDYYTGTAEAFSISGIRLRVNPRGYGFTLSYRYGAQ